MASNESAEEAGLVDSIEAIQDGSSSSDDGNGSSDDDERENDDDDGLATIPSPFPTTTLPPQVVDATPRHTQPQSSTKTRAQAQTQTRTRARTRPRPQPFLDLQPLPPLGPILRPAQPLPPGTAPPQAIFAVQLKVNLEIEVILKARVCGDVLLSVL